MPVAIGVVLPTYKLMAWSREAATSATSVAVRELAGMASKVAWQLTTGSMPAGMAGNTSPAVGADADAFTSTVAAVVAAGVAEEADELDGVAAVVKVYVDGA